MTEWTDIIIMKNNSIGYYIKEGVGSIFTHGFMSFASVCVILACLIIMGSFTLLAVNVSSIIDVFEDENVVLAFVDEALNDSQAMSLKSQIEAVPNVQSVTFIDRDDAMASFVSGYEGSTLFENLDSNILRHRYAVYMVDIAFTQQIQSDIHNIVGIAQVNADLGIAQGFITLKNIVSGVSVVLAVILLLVSLFIMSNTIKLATFERREEIAIMKMVGATNSFIRWPFLLEGFILGLFGSLAAYVAQWGLYQLITARIVGDSVISLITVLPFAVIAVPMFIIFIAIGIGVGVGGSALAIKNYLKI